MATRSTDTDEAAERVQLDLLRRASPGRRLGLALSLSDTVVELSRSALARSRPELTPEELAIRFVRRSYGDSLAREVQAELSRRAS